MSFHEINSSIPIAFFPLLFSIDCCDAKPKKNHSNNNSLTPNQKHVYIDQNQPQMAVDT